MTLKTTTLPAGTDNPVSANSPAVEWTASPTRTALADVAPLAAALIPFSLAIGATIADSDLSAPAALAGSVLMMSGSAQLAAIQILDSGVGPMTAVVTALLINARLVLYSAALAEWFAPLSRWRRLALAVPLIDQTFLLGQERFAEHGSTSWRSRYYLTCTAALLVMFVSSQIVGHQVGASLPEGLGLHLAAPLVFAGMLGSSVKGGPAAGSALVAATVMIVVGPFVGGLALPLAVAAGLVGGSIRRAAENTEAR